MTFTNKAAREMKERVGRLLGEVAEGMPWMGTFHSLSRRRSCAGMPNWWG